VETDRGERTRIGEDWGGEEERAARYSR